jgi:hypothetical protein
MIGFGLVLTYNFNFAVYLGYRNITFFPYRPSLRFHVARAAARLFRQLGRQGRSCAKRIGGDFRGAPRGGGSFRGGGSSHGGGSFRGGGLRGGNLSRLGGSARAGRQYFRAADRAGLQHAEPSVCEPAPA